MSDSTGPPKGKPYVAKKPLLPRHVHGVVVVEIATASAILARSDCSNQNAVVVSKQSQATTGVAEDGKHSAVKRKNTMNYYPGAGGLAAVASATVTGLDKVIVQRTHVPTTKSQLGQKVMEATKTPARGADAKHSAVNTTRKPLSVPGIGLKLRGGLRNEAERVVDEESSAGSLRWARIITLPMNDAKASCFATKLEVVSRNDLTKKQIETSVDTDHNPDLQYATALLETAMTGILPNGTHMVTQAIDYKDIYDYWSKDVLPKLPSAGSSRVVKSPNDYFMDRWGSKGNRSPFLLLDLQDPSLFAKLLKATIQGGNGHDGILDPIKWISGAVPRLRRLHEIHQEFDYNWYRARTDNARKWVIEQLDLIENAFQKASPVPANFKTVMDTVAEFKTEARLIRPPPEDPKKYH
ncbi:unnamed protein product [Fusarium graminearum]|nr:hypothetical protein HG531_004297 [Fusarium graminearum]CAG1966827.1 unnamed protein product [Fusarium graminearum]